MYQAKGKGVVAGVVALLVTVWGMPEFHTAPTYNLISTMSPEP
ncbi:hypothetical protein HOR75_gp60 [Shewanella phage SppYZU05]|uniref:Uncharacterized protein n=1 Tax=Shewanella phage SppYZU05 TaxID=1970795 RepID=A0A1W6JTK5_9CAUD|nr:hypothetical protein HOR75_gp60 [Shewanella phage SppYZU05]ARM70586.1 hypothetical protein SppYZU05_60 [Shewanella phage SppYZU05]